VSVSFRSNPEEALICYQADGYFVERDVLTAAECDQIVAAAMRLPSAVRGNLRPAMQPHRDDPLFLQVLRHPAIVAAVQRLVGGPAVGLQTQFYYTPAGAKGLSRHQDNFFVEAPADAFASAWIALVDVTSANGGLYGYPGTHRCGRLPVHKLSVPAESNQDPNSSNEETVLPEAQAAIDIEVPLGSVVFLHASFVHGSHPNSSPRSRYALLCTYAREGAPFRPGKNARREPIELTVH
jgi:ectoine hydroxylase-related dioxygenase (phytanoyl-CoA dioxygenase family)